MIHSIFSSPTIHNIDSRICLNVFPFWYNKRYCIFIDNDEINKYKRTRSHDYYKKSADISITQFKNIDVNLKYESPTY